MKTLLADKAFRSTGTALALALLLGACAEVSGPAAVANAVGSKVRVALPAVSPAVARVAKTYDVDGPATSRLAGFFGPMIAAAVKGSSLELRTDMTYRGTKDGKVESSGTWKIEGDTLTLHQTHEKGQPSTDTGRGSVKAGRLTVTTEKRGVTLVFNRRVAAK